ncbi:hypothetical protein TNCV_3817621 [Trichonephila clavipes]|nr:hypothetical protein TNCV_3817621 [Trichonephila clavipes]
MIDSAMHVGIPVSVVLFKEIVHSESEQYPLVDLKSALKEEYREIQRDRINTLEKFVDSKSRESEECLGVIADEVHPVMLMVYPTMKDNFCSHLIPLSYSSLCPQMVQRA